ncbi:MAG: hypothetical protein ABL994_20925, partial [Verrucomicrobiales bacterium]
LDGRSFRKLGSLVDLDGSLFWKSERLWTSMEGHSENPEASWTAMDAHSENPEVVKYSKEHHSRYIFGEQSLFPS